MSNLTRSVVFRLDGQRYAVALAVVERIVSAVEITALPEAPSIVLGVIDVAGAVLPVLDLRRRLGLPGRPLRPTDQFLIARTSRRTVVLVVDETQSVLEYPANEVIAASAVAPGLGQVQGVLTLPDGLVLIHDLETFLALDEAQALDEALSAEMNHER